MPSRTELFVLSWSSWQLEFPVQLGVRLVVGERATNLMGEVAMSLVLWDMSLLQLASIDSQIDGEARAP